MHLPDDPNMLFCVINTKLRDCYDSLDALCNDMEIDKNQLIERLASAGFEYNESAKKFW